MAVELKVIHSLKHTLECIAEDYLRNLRGCDGGNFAVRKVEPRNTWYRKRASPYLRWDIDLLIYEDSRFVRRTRKVRLLSVCDGRDLLERTNALYITHAADTIVENFAYRYLQRFRKWEGVDKIVVGEPPAQSKERYSPKTN